MKCKDNEEDLKKEKLKHDMIYLREKSLKAELEQAYNSPLYHSRLSSICINMFYLLLFVFLCLILRVLFKYYQEYEEKRKNDELYDRVLNMGEKIYDETKAAMLSMFGFRLVR